MPFYLTKWRIYNSVLALCLYFNLYVYTKQGFGSPQNDGGKINVDLLFFNVKITELKKLRISKKDNNFFQDNCEVIWLCATLKILYYLKKSNFCYTRFSTVQV